MSLRVLSDTDRQSKLADDQSKLLAQLDGVSKIFAGANHNALEDINLEVFQKDFSSRVSRKFTFKFKPDLRRSYCLFKLGICIPSAHCSSRFV